MFKFSIFSIFLICVTSIGFAQKEIILYGAEPNIYIKHKVMPKENLYSIGRMYNVSPSLFIAPANKIKLTAILKDDQYLKIPLTESNFTQKEGPNDTMTKFTVKYYVQPKDNLVLVSTKMKKIDINTLRSWNNLTTDVLQIGQLLKAGYLLVPNINAWALNNEPNPNPIIENRPTIVFVDSTLKKTEPKPIVINEPIAIPIIKKEPKGDYFKPQYKGLGNVNKTMNLGFFTSNANAETKKYYALINLLSPGTIIKITNPINGKNIYAQVLNGLENVVYNKGLQLRISSNATAALGIIEEDKVVKLEVAY